ncbi:hypothetical protein [Flavobacterium franklandianum]|uniref:Uncharacterized protein n=1 Tax=Flavobacterium franklandianum TaxID=2594430 RepID=A0A553CNC5_9FLAO|nr:hypothetical protein [Flavobacterium franklandianum]TRX22032.1 hypothetical protein FNW17_04995 [Flavobacterium franklandianum]
MNTKDQNMQTAEFVELLAVPAALAKNPLFDIIVEDKINIQSYCNALIAKILELKQSQFPAFIDYQFNQVKNPEIWICKLEKLLANNEAFFSSKTALSRYNKLYILIEKKRTELQSLRVIDTKPKATKRQINADTDDRYFSFFEAKSYINSLDNFNDKIIFLMDEIFEYNQADIVSLNNKLQPYDKQCNQLIEQLQIMRKVKNDFDKENQEKQATENSSNIPFQKIKLNGPTNIITNAFKQMMVDVKPNGKPYIQGKIKDISQIICLIFDDEKGEPLSQATVQTYLSPNRTDKDPNNDIKVRF